MPLKTVAPAIQIRRLLLTLGTNMIAGGAAVYDVESELRRVAWVLGHPRTQVSASPTTVWISLYPGEPAALMSVGEGLRLDQSSRVNDIRREVLAGHLTVPDALEKLLNIRQLPARFGSIGSYLGNLLVAVGICMIMQPGLRNMALVSLLSLVVTFLTRFTGRFTTLRTLLPVIAAFVVALICLICAQTGVIEGPLRTIICPLAVLLPGATLATGMAELAGGMMISGSSRTFYGLTMLALFTLGVIGAALVLDTPPALLANIRVPGLGLWATPVALGAISLGMVLAESLPLRHLPYALAILALTYIFQTLGQNWGHTPAIGTFLGAAIASFGASAIEVTRPNISRLVVFLPSFWLLVPGTLGVIGITQVGTHQAQASTELISVGVIVITIAVGLLLGSALARPLQLLARQHHRSHSSQPDRGVPATVATDVS
ncbi:MAG: threonine/serine ThrE exporter family protein [Propionibacteriaceae bacterium]